MDISQGFNTETVFFRYLSLLVNSTQDKIGGFKLVQRLNFVYEHKFLELYLLALVLLLDRIQKRCLLDLEFLLRYSHYS